MVSAGRLATAVSAGYTHTCALLVGGSVACWGDNSNGQLGIESAVAVGTRPGQMGSNLQLAKLGTGGLQPARATCCGGPSGSGYDLICALLVPCRTGA